MGCVFALRDVSTCRGCISVGGVLVSGGERRVGVLISAAAFCGGLDSSCDMLLIGVVC
jgi:hypothetical protein